MRDSGGSLMHSSAAGSLRTAVGGGGGAVSDLLRTADLTDLRCPVPPTQQERRQRQKTWRTRVRTTDSEMEREMNYSDYPAVDTSVPNQSPSGSWLASGGGGDACFAW